MVSVQTIRDKLRKLNIKVEDAELLLPKKKGYHYESRGGRTRLVKDTVDTVPFLPAAAKMFKAEHDPGLAVLQEHQFRNTKAQKRIQLEKDRIRLHKAIKKSLTWRKRRQALLDGRSLVTVEVHVYFQKDPDTHGTVRHLPGVAHDLVRLKDSLHITIPRRLYAEGPIEAPKSAAYGEIEDWLDHDKDRARDGQSESSWSAVRRLFESRDGWITLNNPVKVKPPTYRPEAARNGKSLSPVLNNALVRPSIRKDIEHATTVEHLLAASKESALFETITQKQDCCMYDVVIVHVSAYYQTTKKSKDKVRGDVERAKRELRGARTAEGWTTHPVDGVLVTYEDIDDDPGFRSLDEFTRVFAAYRIPVQVFNIFAQLVYSFDPHCREEDKMSIMYLLQKDNHVRFCTLTADQICHKYITKENGQLAARPIREVRLSDKWNFRRRRVEQDFTVVDNESDLVQLACRLTDFDEERGATYVVAYTKKNSAKDLFFEMLPKHQATILDSTCQRIKFEYDQGTIEVKSVGLPSDRNLCWDSDDQLEQGVGFLEQLQRTMFHQRHMSRYPRVIKTIQQHTRQALSRVLCPAGAKLQTHTVDRVKQYTHCFMQLQKLPVLTSLDVFERAGQHPKLEDYSLYLVKCTDKAFKDFGIYFDKRYSLCVGMALKAYPRQSYTVEYVLKPSILVDNPLLPLIERIYTQDSLLSLSHVKDLLNIIWGQLETRNNSWTQCETFLDEEEGRFYANQVGATLGCISNDTGDLSAYFMKKLHLTELQEGFYIIKVFILDLARCNMQTLASQAQDKGCRVCTIKTDELGLQVPAEVDPRALFAPVGPKTTLSEEYDKIGCVRLEANCDTKVKARHEFVENTLFNSQSSFGEVQQLRPDTEDFDEYDKEGLADIIEEALSRGERVMVLGRYAGLGKTDAIVTLYFRVKARGQKMTVCVPFHAMRSVLAEKGIDPDDVITLHEVFRVDGADRDKGGLDSSVRTSQFLHFEEIGLAGHAMFSRMDELARKYPKLNLTATGDFYQIESVRDDLLENCNYPDPRLRRITLLDRVFSSQLELKIVKSLSPKDRQTLEALFADIFSKDYEGEEHQHLLSVMRKYFGSREIKNPFAKELSEQQKAKYRKCKIFVHHLTQKALINSILAPTYRKKDSNFGKIKLEVGLEIVCKKPTSVDKVQLQNNDIFVVKSVCKPLQLENKYSGQRVTLTQFAKDWSADKLFKHFDLTYAVNAHCCQGSRANPGQKVILFDVGSPYMTASIAYVLVTRSRDFDKIYFVADQGKSIRDIHARVRQQVKAHRKTRGATDDEPGVVAQKIIARLKKYHYRCPGKPGSYCGRLLIKEAGDHYELDFELDRDNGDRGLEGDNTRPLCKRCNAGKASSDHPKMKYEVELETIYE